MTSDTSSVILRPEESHPFEIQSISHISLQDSLLEEGSGIPTSSHHSPTAPSPAASEAASTSQQSSPAKWPASPNSLRDASPSVFLRLLPSVLLLLIPLAFYVLGIYILRLDGQLERPGHDFGDTVVQAMKIASTLWPILFAAVVGAMLRAATLYHAERGTVLGTLEVLTTSQTLVSTVRGYFSHRIFSIWTLAIIGLWSLSPAGGQAVLRSVEPKVHKQSQDYHLQYYPSDCFNVIRASSPLTSGDGPQEAVCDYHRIADSALSSPDVTALYAKGVSLGFNSTIERLGGEEQAAQSAQSDLWGNVRIPFLHLLPDYNKDERDKWVEVSLTDIAPYSSLIGHGIRGVPLSSVGNISLSLQTFYQTLSCVPFFNGSEWLQHNQGKLMMHTRTNISIFDEFPEESGENANMFFDYIRPEKPLHPSPIEMPTTDVDKSVLVLGARQTNDLDNFLLIKMTHCEVTMSYVETGVKCIRASFGGTLSCFASKMRETPGKPPSNWSSLNWFPDPWLGAYLAYIPDTIQPSHFTYPSGLERYLLDPSNAFQSYYQPPRYEDIPVEIFQARLALLLNTFFHASLNASNILGADGVSISDNAAIDPKEYGNATGTWTEFTPSRYEVQYTWFALYFAATTVLAICTIVTVVISALTRAPDLFGGVSSLTRDSAFMTTVPDGGSSLSGSERARVLRNMWVRIQDVKPEDDVGRIAFSDQKELGAAAALRWERKYE